MPELLPAHLLSEARRARSAANAQHQQLADSLVQTSEFSEATQLGWRRLFRYAEAVAQAAETIPTDISLMSHQVIGATQTKPARELDIAQVVGWKLISHDYVAGIGATTRQPAIDMSHHAGALLTTTGGLALFSATGPETDDGTEVHILVRDPGYNHLTHRDSMVLLDPDSPPPLSLSQMAENFSDGPRFGMNALGHALVEFVAQTYLDQAEN